MQHDLDILSQASLRGSRDRRQSIKTFTARILLTSMYDRLAPHTSKRQSNTLHGSLMEARIEGHHITLCAWDTAVDVNSVLACSPIGQQLLAVLVHQQDVLEHNFSRALHPNPDYQT